MPTHIKIIVSVVTLIVGAIFFYFENMLGDFLSFGSGLGAVESGGVGLGSIFRSTRPQMLDAMK